VVEGYVKTNCCQRTFEGYESIVRKHLVLALGHLQLKELQPSIVGRYYGKECEQVSARSVQHNHRVLSQSLKYAVRQGYFGRNPCELVSPPRWKGKTMRTMTPVEVGILLETAEGNLYHPVFYCALNTGLRQAELLGLRWRDIALDPDMLSISVQQVLYKRRGVREFKEPKTEHSRRRVNMTPKLALYLALYRAEREELYRELGKTLPLDSLVFVTAEGNPIDPTVLSHAFSKLVKQAGLEGVRFHNLRHTFASLMLMRGAKPKVNSEALGHSSVAFTMDVYSHIIDGMQQDAVALLDEVIPVGVFSRNHTNLAPSLHKPTLAGR